jgi:TonB family protein
LRVLKPSLWVFCAALLASLSIHLPVYEVLGALAEVVLKAPEEEASTVVEMELAPLPGEPAIEEPEPPEPEPLRAAPEQAKAKEKADEKPDMPAPQPERAEAPKPQLQLQPPQPPPPPVAPPPPKPIDTQHAVTQKSQDPNVPPPDNAQFIAEENNRVLEETEAQVRNLVEDSQEQQPNRPESPSQEDALGDSQETEAAQLEDAPGEDEPQTAERTDVQAPNTAGEEHAHSAEEHAHEPVQHAQAEQQARVAELPAQTQEIRINDGSGTFVIKRSLPREALGDQQRAAADGQRAREGAPGAATRGAPNLKLSFSQYEDTFGSDAVESQRERYAEQRRSKSGGQSRQEVWKKFRGAIENHLSHVRPGNQTALNTAASPFAAYLAAVHRQIHQNFADQFLSGLPLAGSPLSDPNLLTTLEIVINGDGTLDNVGVARSSGFLPFDYGAFSSVQKAAPFPPPPTKILSSDGRVYVHWGFHRNHRACATFNAQPFMLNNPERKPDTPSDQPRDRSPARPGTPGTPAPSGPLLKPDEGELGSIEGAPFFAPAARPGRRSVLARADER